MSGILALWADDATAATADLTGVGRDGAPPMSVQGRIMVLGHLAEAQYRLGDWDAAAANGALAVSLVRDAGVLLGAGVANALAAYVAAGRGDWDDRRGTRLDRGAGGGVPALVGRAGARRDGPGGARPGPRRPRHDGRGPGGLRRPGRPRPRRPGRGAPLAGAARRGVARARPDRRGAGRARRAGGARGGAPAGLVGAGGGPAAVRDRGGLRGRRRGCAGPTRGRRRWRSRCPPSCPGPASRWRTPGTCSPRVSGARPSTCCGRPTPAGPAGRGAVPRAVRRPAARRRAAPPGRGRDLRPHPAGARRRPPGGGGPHATRRPAPHCSSRAGPSRST